ncbi:MAG: fused MFS/spermidine synthase [Anaerolineales bacterium]|nr:fused MFS/spermidine synthase [Anaerolineales bacterium]
MRRYLYFTVFVSGMTTLAGEFAASRLLGNVFGTSNLVWAAIIGLILVYLTVGYFLGGRWADRSPHARTLFAILAWGAFSLGVVPYVAGPVLRAAASAFDTLRVGVLAGAFAAVLVLFTIPITLLGMISPFAIRLSMEDPGKAGNVAGTIYGISTIGSFIGTFLPTLILIPTIGTTRTFLVFSLLLLCVAIAGLRMSVGVRKALPYLWMVLALALLAVFGGRGSIKATSGQIYETESAYNYIQVLEYNGTRYLRLNEGQGIHSQYHPEMLNYGGPWQQFLVGPFFYAGRTPEQVERIAVVGLAAGTTARQAEAVFPNVVIDGWEIDPAIVAVGRAYFAMNLANLNVYVQDGRWGLEQSPAVYDLIIVDAYRPPYIPPHLTTREFFQIAADRLQPDGVLAINIGRAPGDRRLIDGLATTIGTIFPSIYVMDIPGTFNSILYATLQPTDAGDLQKNLFALLARGDVDPLLLESLWVSWENLQPAPQQTVVFTDDLSPIEWLTNNLILNFLLEGGADTLQ